MAVSNLDDCIFLAENSKAIEPMSFAKCSVLKDELDVVAGVRVLHRS